MRALPILLTLAILVGFFLFSAGRQASAQPRALHVDVVWPDFSDELPCIEFIHVQASSFHSDWDVTAHGNVTLWMRTGSGPWIPAAIGDLRLDVAEDGSELAVWHFDHVELPRRSSWLIYRLEAWTDSGLGSEPWLHLVEPGGDGCASLTSTPRLEDSERPTAVPPPAATPVPMSPLSPTPTTAATQPPLPTLLPRGPNEHDLSEQHRVVADRVGFGMSSGLMGSLEFTESQRGRAARLTLVDARYEQFESFMSSGRSVGNRQANEWSMSLHRVVDYSPDTLRQLSRSRDCRNPGTSTLPACLLTAVGPGESLLWGVEAGRHVVVFWDRDDRYQSRRLQSVRFRLEYPDTPAPTRAPTFTPTLIPTPRPTPTPRAAGLEGIEVAAAPLFGMDYAKDLRAEPRGQQAEVMVGAQCSCTRDGIDLANLWTAPDEFDWSVRNPENGDLTYDEVVDLSLARGIQVFGSIGTTPRWALDLAESGWVSESEPRVLVDSVKRW